MSTMMQEVSSQKLKGWMQIWAGCKSSDRRPSVQMLAEELNMNWEMVW